jgi:hypothetical protein
VLLISKGVSAGIVLTALCSLSTGCFLLEESSFQLANDSRLPRWASLPPQSRRDSFSLTMTYYVVPSRHAQFVLTDQHGSAIESDSGEMKCPHSFHLHGSSRDSDYPAYEAISVRGVTEIVEHKKMEPVFSITDDPAVWKQYDSFGCSESRAKDDAAKRLSR